MVPAAARSPRGEPRPRRRQRRLWSRRLGGRHLPLPPLQPRRTPTQAGSGCWEPTATRPHQPTPQHPPPPRPPPPTCQRPRPRPTRRPPWLLPGGAGLVRPPPPRPPLPLARKARGTRSTGPPTRRRRPWTPAETFPRGCHPTPACAARRERRTTPSRRPRRRPRGRTTRRGGVG
jgi:hypothetical protein